MRIKFFPVLIIAALVFYSCSETCEDGNYKPPDCNGSSPAEGEVQLKITIGKLNPSVPVEIFIGDVEDNNFCFADTLSVEEFSYTLSNNDYSVRAKYKAVIGGDTVTVYSIDGGSLQPSESEYCDGTCYNAGTLKLNARLELGKGMK